MTDALILAQVVSLKSAMKQRPERVSTEVSERLTAAGEEKRRLVHFPTDGIGGSYLLKHPEHGEVITRWQEFDKWDGNGGFLWWSDAEKDANAEAREYGELEHDPHWEEEWR